MSGKKIVVAAKPKVQQNVKKVQTAKQSNSAKDRQVSNAVIRSDVRVPRFDVVQGSKPGSIKIRGQDLVAPVVVPSTGTTALGQVLFNSAVGPSSGVFSGTRLSQYGKLYERYLFKELALHWSPTVATTLPIGIVMAYDRDPSDPTPPSSIQGLQSLIGHDGTVVGPIWSPMTLRAKLDAPSQAFYTNSYYDADERLAYQGQLYVAASNAASGLGVGATLGLLWIEYEIEFFQPQLEGPTLYSSQTRTAGPFIATVTDAWASTLASLNTASSVAAPYLLRLLSNGKTGFKVPPGNYELVQRFLNSAAAALYYQITAPIVTNVNGLAPAPVVTLLDNANNNVAAGISLTRHRVVITDPEGAEINGTIAGDTGVDTSVIKLLRLDNIPV